MRVVFLMEAGIPSYRDFLFQHLQNEDKITEVLVVHTGKIYNGKKGTYKDVKVKFIGSNKLGMHIGIFKYLKQADVIISSYNLRIVSCWLPAFLFRKKWIFWGKGLGSNDNFVIQTLRKISSKWCKYILVYNDVKKQELVKKLNLANDVVISYNNTVFISNPSDFTNFPKKYFLYFGRIQKRKGLLELVDEYNQYKESVTTPEYKLKFVGDGDFKQILIKRVEDLGIQQFVEFCPGVYTDEEISEHFKEAVIYVSPYNVGLSVINSFAYGVPVLTCVLPQVGPEFNYLNKNNSITVNSIQDFKEVFTNIQDWIPKFKNITNNYSKDLHYSNMLSHFTKIILKVGNE